MAKERIATSYNVVSGAYGRDYKTAKDARAAFLVGWDFLYHEYTGNTVYCSVRDFTPGTVQTIRYKRMTQVCTVRIPIDVAKRMPSE